MALSVNENRKFADFIIDNDNLLDEAVEWISQNLSPEEVFGIGALEVWAEVNGYILENDGNT